MDESETARIVPNCKSIEIDLDYDHLAEAEFCEKFVETNKYTPENSPIY